MRRSDRREWLWLSLALAASVILSLGAALAGTGDEIVASADRRTPPLICHVSGYRFPCVIFEMEGTTYTALYIEGEVAVIKRHNDDGTQTNVWETTRYQPGV